MQSVLSREAKRDALRHKRERRRLMHEASVGAIGVSAKYDLGKADARRVLRLFEILWAGRKANCRRAIDAHLKSLEEGLRHATR